MAVQLVVKSIDRSRRKLRVTFNLIFSGAYVAGGDPLDFTQATDPTFQGYRKPFLAPEFIEPNGSPGGNAPECVVGAANNNSKYKLFSSANTELAAGAYNAAVIADLNCSVTAVFGRGAN